MEFIISGIIIFVFIISFFLPKMILYIVIATMPFYKLIGSLSISEAEITVFDGLIMALFIASIIKLPLLLRNNKLILFDKAVVLWALLNIMYFLFYQTDFIYGLNIFRNFVGIPTALYFLVRFYVIDIQTLQKLLWCIVVSTCLMALFGCVEFLDTHQRINTVLDAGLAGSILMLMGLLSGIVLFIKTKKNLLKIFLVTTIILNFIGVILVFGRIIIFSMLIFPLFTLFLLKKPKTIFFMFTACFLIIGLVAPLKVMIYDEGLKSYARQRRMQVDPNATVRLTNTEHIKAGLGVRTIPYRISIDYIIDKPLFGYGYSIHNQLKERGFYLAHSHNIGLDILLRTGMVGLCAFITLIFLFVMNIKYKNNSFGNNKKAFLIVFVSLVFIILANSFANSLPNLISACSLWLCIGITISISEKKYQNRQ